MKLELHMPSIPSWTEFKTLGREMSKMRAEAVEVRCAQADYKDLQDKRTLARAKLYIFVAKIAVGLLAVMSVVYLITW